MQLGVSIADMPLQENPYTETIPHTLIVGPFSTLCRTQWGKKYSRSSFKTAEGIYEKHEKLTRHETLDETDVISDLMIKEASCYI